MKPLYFPFTYINDDTADDLCAFFKQITVYQPGLFDLCESMQELSDKGEIDIRIPVTGDEAKLKALLKEYRTWAELHQKTDTAFLNAAEETQPFFDETYPSQLASQIKKNMVGGKEKSKTDFLFNSRLFLTIAQEYDRQQEAILKDLASASEMEKKLLSDLTDDLADKDENIFSNNTKNSDYGQNMYKIKERLEAWAHLVINDNENPGFFITDNKEAFETIAEIYHDAEMVIGLNQIPVLTSSDIMNNWKILLAKQIEGLLSDKCFKVSKDINAVPAVDKSGVTKSLKIFKISDKSGYEFVQDILGRNLDVIQNDVMQNKDKKDKSILFGIIE